jgi:hypothetical protein
VAFISPICAASVENTVRPFKSNILIFSSGTSLAISAARARVRAVSGCAFNASRGSVWAVATKSRISGHIMFAKTRVRRTLLRSLLVVSSRVTRTWCMKASRPPATAMIAAPITA